MTVEAYRVGRSDAAGKADFVDLHGDTSAPFSSAYGIKPDGAVLVRPDGYIAWRQPAHSGDAAQRLSQTLNAVLCRTE